MNTAHARNGLFVITADDAGAMEALARPFAHAVVHYLDDGHWPEHPGRTFECVMVAMPLDDGSALAAALEFASGCVAGGGELLLQIVGPSSGGPPSASTLSEANQRWDVEQLTTVGAAVFARLRKRSASSHQDAERPSYPLAAVVEIAQSIEDARSARGGADELTDLKGEVDRCRSAAGQNAERVALLEEELRAARANQAAAEDALRKAQTSYTRLRQSRLGRTSAWYWRTRRRWRQLVGRVVSPVRRSTVGRR